MEVKEMAMNWEGAFIAELARWNGGVSPVEKIDHEKKVVEIKQDAKMSPYILRTADHAVKAATGDPEFRVVQLT